jgi:hypothetical protein
MTKRVSYFIVESSQVFGTVGYICPHVDEELFNHVLHLENTCLICFSLLCDIWHSRLLNETIFLTD